MNEKDPPPMFYHLIISGYSTFPHHDQSGRVSRQSSNK